MTVDDFAKILATEMEADQSTRIADDLMRKARKQLTRSGSLGQITASGVNGKSFTRTVELTAAQVIDACRRAIAAYASTDGDDGIVSATYADFASIKR